MDRVPIHRLEILVAVLGLAWAFLLHCNFFVSAGALWRDEANSVLQAGLPAVKDIWATLQYDSFPVLYPLTLRCWLSFEWAHHDPGIRLFGLLVGLALFASFWFIARMLGSRIPVVSVLLLCSSPLFISEAQSIRPYGVGLLGLAWLFAGVGRYLLRPTAGWLCLASVAALVTVQSSYANALFAGVLVISASAAAFGQGKRRTALIICLPGLVAALSLLPYIAILRRASAWVPLVHYQVDWRAFLDDLVRVFSPAFPIVWIAFAGLAASNGIRAIKGCRHMDPAGLLLVLYTSVAAVLGMIVQILFIESMKVPPFPRYFLPCMVLLAFAVEVLLQKSAVRVRAYTVLAALLLMAWPSWTWLSLRRSNADQVAAVLSRRATKEDLIVVSPWFLHPSFQYYYSGSVPWMTIPPLARRPIMRYDLVKQAMQTPDPSSGIGESLQEKLHAKGTIWLVSQIVAKDSSVSSAPQRPAYAQFPNGYDYVRFRSYWEREILYRLQECCRREEWPLPSVGQVWNEEHLLLSRWEAKQR